MFQDLKIEVSARFFAINEFLLATRKLPEPSVATAKGLAFVQIYAVYEYTVNSTVNIAIEAIKGHRHKLRDISPSLLSLFLDPELRSLRDISSAKLWNRRLQLFERAFSYQRIDLASGTVVPSDGSHYRYSHLELIFRVFEIRRMPVRRKKHISRIAEVVDHRNSVAHGRDTAAEIGRRYTTKEVQIVLHQMESVCNSFLGGVERYCLNVDQQRR